LGSKQVAFLYKQGLVCRPGDVFRLTIDDLIDLDGWGERSSSQLITAVSRARTLSLHRWIYALGIPTIGHVSAKSLAQYYQTQGCFEQSMQQCIQERSEINGGDGSAYTNLLNISGIGQDTASELIAFMHNEQEWIKDLAQYIDILPEHPSARIKITPLFNKSIVFTGTLPTMTRAEAKKRAEDAGARVLSGLSPQVDFLVSGEKSGQKIDKARSLNVTILDAEQWQSLLDHSGS
jgi:DNA ligase (NAD+)